MLRIVAAALGLLLLAGQLSAAEPDASQTTKSAVARTSERPRVLFFTARDSEKCTEELARLNRSGGDFEQMRATGWKIGTEPDNHLQIVDRDDSAALVAELGVVEFPTVVYVEKAEVVRAFQSGCTTPLDMWTISWLAKGVNERPAGMVPEAARAETTGHYPLRGNHWSIDGDWNPTRTTVISHLRGPVHGGQILVSYQIETWSLEELKSLHDNLHEREMGGVSFGQSASRSSNTNNFSASRKASGR